MPVIKQGHSLGKSHTTTNDHYIKSDFVLVKSHNSFYGQINKDLKSIFHWLVTLLALIFFRW